MTTGTWMEKDNYQRQWTGFTRFVLLQRKGHHKDTHGLGGDGRGNKQTIILMMYGQICGNLCPMQRKNKAKQRWTIEKPKLNNARPLRGIFFIEPNDEEFKLTMKATRRKLEVPTPAAMPCKIPIKSSGETHRNIWKRRTKYACVVGADEARDKGSKELDTNLIKITSLHKGWILSLITVLCANSFRCLKHSKFQMQRRQWRKNEKNWRKSWHGSWRKSETRKKWSMKQRIRAEKFILRHWWISVI